MPKFLSGIIFFILSGCAVMQGDLPVWSKYSQPDAGVGIQLKHTITGSGKPLILIHGFGSSSYSWRHVIKPLSSEHQLITLDLKGFGESPKPRDDQYSVYDQARLVRNFIINNQLQDASIIGHSFGGGVALVTAVYLQQTHPDLIDKLVLIDSVAYPQDLPAFVEILATPVLGPVLIHLLPNKTQITKLLQEVYYDDAQIPQDAIDHYAAILDQSNAKYAVLKTARQLIPQDLDHFAQNYARLDLPVLIIWGRQDDMIPLKIGERLNDELPNSRMTVIDQVGHAVQEENPALVLPVLKAFLR